MASWYEPNPNPRRSRGLVTALVVAVAAAALLLLWGWWIPSAMAHPGDEGAKLHAISERYAGGEFVVRCRPDHDMLGAGQTHVGERPVLVELGWSECHGIDAILEHRVNVHRLNWENRFLSLGTLLHETRHVYQDYAGWLDFQSPTYRGNAFASGGDELDAECTAADEMYPTLLRLGYRSRLARHMRSYYHRLIAGGPPPYGGTCK